MGDLTKAQKKFPSLYRAWIDYGRPELEKTALGAYVASFLKDGIDFEIEQVDQSLQVLLLRFDVVALKDPLSALFGATNENQRERTFRKASTELCALAKFERLGLLNDLGWPPGFGDNPPFDFRFSAGEAIIPVDVKDANGDGLLIAERAIDRIVKPWAKANGIASTRLALRYLGAISQSLVGSNIFNAGTLQGFEEWLQQRQVIPDEPYNLQVGETAISVRIVPEAELKHQSGGIQLVSTLASILSATFEHHIVEKSQAAQRESRVPFLIVYVKLPGHGSSDIKTTATFRDALCNVAQRASSLEHEVAALWLGSIYYHPVGEEMHFYCCLRSDAEWPAGLTPEDLTKYLKGTLSPI